MFSYCYSRNSYPFRARTNSIHFVEAFLSIWLQGIPYQYLTNSLFDANSFVGCYDKACLFNTNGLNVKLTSSFRSLVVKLVNFTSAIYAKVQSNHFWMHISISLKRSKIFPLCGVYNMLLTLSPVLSTNWSSDRSNIFFSTSLHGSFAFVALGEYN